MILERKCFLMIQYLHTGPLTGKICSCCLLLGHGKWCNDIRNVLGCEGGQRRPTSLFLTGSFFQLSNQQASRAQRDFTFSVQFSISGSATTLSSAGQRTIPLSGVKRILAKVVRADLLQFRLSCKGRLFDGLAVPITNLYQRIFSPQVGVVNFEVLMCKALFVVAVFNKTAWLAIYNYQTNAIKRISRIQKRSNSYYTKS